jgi:hypothetical protein
VLHLKPSHHTAHFTHSPVSKWRGRQDCASQLHTSNVHDMKDSSQSSCSGLHAPDLVEIVVVASVGQMPFLQQLHHSNSSPLLQLYNEMLHRACLFPTTTIDLPWLVCLLLLAAAPVASPCRQPHHKQHEDHIHHPAGSTCPCSSVNGVCSGQFVSMFSCTMCCCAQQPRML